MFGQSQPRVRYAGVWEYVDHEEGVGPEDWKRVGGESSELSKLSRAELDVMAEEQGLDPADYKNKAEVVEALGG